MGGYGFPVVVVADTGQGSDFVDLAFGFGHCEDLADAPGELLRGLVGEAGIAADFFVFGGLAVDDHGSPAHGFD